MTQVPEVEREHVAEGQIAEESEHSVSVGLDAHEHDEQVAQSAQNYQDERVIAEYFECVDHVTIFFF